MTPADIVAAEPAISPLSERQLPFYRDFARPLPKPLNRKDPSNSLKIDAIFVFSDPRDWLTDATVMLDLLLSRRGVVGTLSAKNNDARLPNRGYLQDGQPPVFFSNPDLWWSSDYHLPRLGQGGFREAFMGLWRGVTGGEKMGVELPVKVMGKPSQLTYSMAEQALVAHRDVLLGKPATALKTVYMVGDNPGKCGPTLLNRRHADRRRVRHSRWQQLQQRGRRELAHHPSPNRRLQGRRAVVEAAGHCQGRLRCRRLGAEGAGPRRQGWVVS